MQNTIRHRLGVAVLVLAASGCAETALSEPAIFEEIPLLSTQPTPDPPKAWPVNIDWANASVSFPAQSAPYPAAASVLASMSYDAYHASMGARLWLRGTTSEQRDYTPREQHTSTFLNNTFSTSFPMMVANSCGHILEADVSYRAWWRGLYVNATEFTLEEDKEFRSPNGSQLPCPEEDKTVRRTSIGSGGGTTGCPDCIQEAGYTWCRVTFTYDLRTGEILSTYVQYCW